MTAQTFRPTSRNISSITNANPAVVTTYIPHGYFDGIYVRIVFPDNFGMEPLSNQVFEAKIISDTSFSIDADTTQMSPFFNGVSLINFITSTNPVNVFVASPQFTLGQQVIISGVTSGPTALNGVIFIVLRVTLGLVVSIDRNGIGLPLYGSGGILQTTQSPQVIPVAEISATLQNAEKNNLTPIGGP